MLKTPPNQREDILPAPESSHAILCKQKTADIEIRRRFFYGRGWITQAALLKTAHWAVFALSSTTAPQLFESTLAVLCRNSNKTETPASSQRWSSWWARVDSNHHGFVPPKPLDFKKLETMRIFRHPKWNTKPFRPGRNVKSGLQSGLFLGVRGVLGQHYGDGLRSGNITARDIMCVPAKGIHTAAVADHAAQLSG